MSIKDTPEYTAAINFRVKHDCMFKILSTERGFYFKDDKETRFIFKIRLTRNRKSYTFKYGQSINNGSKKPDWYDILSCLTKHDPGSFENFCADYGYEEDSRKAFKTYLDVQKEYKAVERLFGDVLEELQEIN